MFMFIGDFFLNCFFQVYSIFHLFFTLEISFFSERIGGLRIGGICFLLSFAFFSLLFFFFFK